MKREMTIRIQQESIRRKYSVLFGKTHLRPYSIMLSFFSQEHQTSLLHTAAKHLTHLELTLSQCT